MVVIPEFAQRISGTQGLQSCNASLVALGPSSRTSSEACSMTPYGRHDRIDGHYCQRTSNGLSQTLASLVAAVWGSSGPEP